MEKGITARHCPALIPPFYYHLTPFNGGPPLPISSAHTICSQTPSSDSVKSVIQPRSSGWGGWVLGGVTSGGVGSFGGTSGRFLTPASSILHGSAQGPHNPLCWDWWPAVVRETNTLLKQAYMDITGSEADLWRHSWMYPKQCSCLSSEQAFHSFHYVTDMIHYIIYTLTSFFNLTFWWMKWMKRHLDKNNWQKSFQVGFNLT